MNVQIWMFMHECSYMYWMIMHGCSCMDAHVDAHAWMFMQLVNAQVGTT